MKVLMTSFVVEIPVVSKDAAVELARRLKGSGYKPRVIQNGLVEADGQVTMERQRTITFDGEGGAG